MFPSEAWVHSQPLLLHWPCYDSTLCCISSLPFPIRFFLQFTNGLTPLYIKKDISSLHPSFFLLFLHNLSSFLKGCVYTYVCMCVHVCVHACVCVGGVQPEGNIRDPWNSYMQLLTAWLGCCDPNLQQLWALVTAEPSLQLLHPDSWCGSLYSLFLPPHR